VIHCLAREKQKAMINKGCSLCNRDTHVGEFINSHSIHGKI
jgi:hypothetical protein